MLTIIFLLTQPRQIISNPLTFVLFKVERILFVCDDFLHVDNTAVFELTQNLDLSYGRDGETLLLIVQTHFLQSHQFTWEVKMSI